ncbi:MAG: hypothetical protein J6W90_03705, partial [Verrucomicrobia bacterium]|nr:hypothetical protein [Verrucomicrobiota bacterium]
QNHSADAIISKKLNWKRVSDRIDFLQLLSSRLTKYQLPKAIGQVEVLPFTPNGKIDRIALKHLAFKVFGKNPFKNQNAKSVLFACQNGDFFTQ